MFFETFYFTSFRKSFSRPVNFFLKKEYLLEFLFLLKKCIYYLFCQLLLVSCNTFFLVNAYPFAFLVTFWINTNTMYVLLLFFANVSIILNILMVLFMRNGILSFIFIYTQSSFYYTFLSELWVVQKFALKFPYMNTFLKEIIICLYFDQMK